MLQTTDTLSVERRAGLSGSVARARIGSILRFFSGFLALIALAAPLMAQAQKTGGEASLKLPDLGSVSFLGGISAITCCWPGSS